jgi:hypothetical protein
MFTRRPFLLTFLPPSSARKQGNNFAVAASLACSCLSHSLSQPHVQCERDVQRDRILPMNVFMDIEQDLRRQKTTFGETEETEVNPSL